LERHSVLETKPALPLPPCLRVPLHGPMRHGRRGWLWGGLWLGLALILHERAARVRAFRAALPSARPCPRLYSQLMEGSDSAFRAARANRSALLPGPDMVVAPGSDRVKVRPLRSRRVRDVTHASPALVGRYRPQAEGAALAGRADTGGLDLLGLAEGMVAALASWVGPRRLGGGDGATRGGGRGPRVTDVARAPLVVKDVVEKKVRWIGPGIGRRGGTWQGRVNRR
jgi:hypothetical protein